MPFRFALAPMLRLRQSIERQRSMRLRESGLAVTRAQETLSRLEQFLSNSSRADQESLGAGRSAAELQFASVLRDHLCILHLDAETELRRLELERQRVAAEYQRAYQDREVLEAVRTRKRHAYDQEAMQREQRELDAAHLLRLWRNRLG